MGSNKKKSADGIIKASMQRGDNIFVKEGSKVHKLCRQKYTNQKNIDILKSHQSNPLKEIHP